MASSIVEEKFKAVLSRYEQPTKNLKYGTAGFRDKFDLPLHVIFVKMGIFASLRTLSVGGKCIGAVITASHNLEQDNGLKLVDADGGMFAASWEPYAETLANCSIEQFYSHMFNIATEEKLGVEWMDAASIKGSIVVGRDTRPHSQDLTACVKAGVAAMGGQVLDIGEVTTPVLHYVVRDMNETNFKSQSSDTFDAIAWKRRYYEMLSTGYTELLATITEEERIIQNEEHNDSNKKQKCATNLVLDASFGVGSIVVEEFLEAHQRCSSEDTRGSTSCIEIDIRNKARMGKVNENCGAEHAQKLQQPPSGVHAEGDCERLMCSFDGDGDRIVFHAFMNSSSSSVSSRTSSSSSCGGGSNPEWVLFDGDKISALFAVLLQQEIIAADLADKFKFGVVQTAYANGASTAFLTARGLNVQMAKTGVKHLHHKAVEAFDVGVYFEANGHGTTLFSKPFVEAVNSHNSSGSSSSADGGSRKNLAFRRLKACVKLVNPAVGDALSDMLFVLAALKVLRLSKEGWRNLYTDLPSVQVKVAVPDKNLISCSADETHVVQPAALQLELDAAMRAVTAGRCFVRPSGTEDVVRIYAEADTKEEAERLTELARAAIKTHLGE